MAKCKPPLLFAAAALVTPGLQHGADPFAAQRQRMVQEQVASRGVRNPEVLRVMRITPRHLFVPGAVRSLAYRDQPLPLGHGATISQPYVVAFMTELLQPQKQHRVLEVGTGSGYQAAVLSQLVSHVYSVEIVPELARDAGQSLMRLGYANVTVRRGDGYKGWPEMAPFDGIILTAAPPEVPQVLIEQLAKAGRLVAPVGTSSDQQLILIEKRADGSIRRSTAGWVLFVPMKSAMN